MFLRLGYQVYNFPNSASPITLLVLHGLYGSKSNFRSVVTDSAISSHVGSAYLVDLRNHGDSDHAFSMSYADVSHDISNFIQENDLSKCVPLI